MDRNIDFESYPVEARTKRDPVEELVVEAPSLRNGVLRDQHISVWVVLRVYDARQPGKKKQNKLPDRWQIEEESFKFATIEDLAKILDKTK